MNLRPASYQDRYLDTLREERTQVIVHLANGVKMRGRIEGSDAYAIWLRADALEMIYKHAIVCVARTEPVEQVASSVKRRPQRIKEIEATATRSERRAPEAFEEPPPPRRPKISFRHPRSRSFT